MASLHLTPAAENDLAATFAWYERQRAHLGVRFVKAAGELFERIRESPRLFPEIAPNWRRALVTRFPYGAYFTVEEDRIVVLAVLHLHRDPAAWQRRSSNG